MKTNTRSIKTNKSCAINVPPLTARLQRFHRQLSDYFTLQTKSWSRRRQLLFWGGWVGLGFYASVSVTYNAFVGRHVSATRRPATAVTDRPQSMNINRSTSEHINWVQVLAYQGRLDSLIRLDTLTMKSILTPRHQVK